MYLLGGGGGGGGRFGIKTVLIGRLCTGVLVFWNLNESFC